MSPSVEHDGVETGEVIFSPITHLDLQEAVKFCRFVTAAKAHELELGAGHATAQAQEFAVEGGDAFEVAHLFARFGHARAHAFTGALLERGHEAQFTLQALALHEGEGELARCICRVQSTVELALAFAVHFQRGIQGQARHQVGTAVAVLRPLTVAVELDEGCAVQTPFKGDLAAKEALRWPALYGALEHVKANAVDLGLACDAGFA